MQQILKWIFLVTIVLLSSLFVLKNYSNKIEKYADNISTDIIAAQTGTDLTSTITKLTSDVYDVKNTTSTTSTDLNVFKDDTNKQLAGLNDSINGYQSDFSGKLAPLLDTQKKQGINIDSLNTDVYKLKTDTGGLQNNFNTLNNSVVDFRNTFNTRLGTAEGNITSLFDKSAVNTSRISTVYDELTAFEKNTGMNFGTVNDGITTLTNNYNLNSARLNTVSGELNALGNNFSVFRNAQTTYNTSNNTSMNNLLKTTSDLRGDLTNTTNRLQNYMPLSGMTTYAEKSTVNNYLTKLNTLDRTVNTITSDYAKNSTFDIKAVAATKSDVLANQLIDAQGKLVTLTSRLDNLSKNAVTQAELPKLVIDASGSTLLQAAINANDTSIRNMQSQLTTMNNPRFVQNQLGPNPKFNSMSRSDSNDWFRINEQGKMGPGTAIYGGVAVNDGGGISVGAWEKAPQGQINAYGNIMSKTNLCINGSCMNEADLNKAKAGGAQGPTGPMGPLGPSGPKGDMGVSGPIGPVGPNGLTGDIGATGPIGPMGPSGPKGDIGATGAKGDIGLLGPSGPKGDVGPVGANGLIGPNGPKGDKGDKGDTGLRGDIGPPGPTGATGPVGPAGTATSSGINWIDGRLDTVRGVDVSADNPGPMIQRLYAGNDERYGMGQWANGATRLYTGVKNPAAFASLSTAKADGTFNDVVKVTADNKIHMSGDTWHNDKNIYLRGPLDTSNGMKYDSTVEGPNISGTKGGTLLAGGKSQIMWNVDGSVSFPENGLKFTRNWSDYPASAIDRAEIANDITVGKQLMIVGNRSAGAERKVGIWDSLVVNGKLTATGNIEGNSNLCIGGKCVNSAALDKLNQNIMGPVGPMGPMGPTGSNGLPGQVGPTGPMGPTGSNGLPGQVGPTGPMGPTGSNGLPGQVGPVGPAGPKGDTGATGPVGPAGTAAASGINWIDGRLDTVRGVNVSAGDPGPMIEKQYGSVGDRYGMGQFVNGTTRLYTGTTHLPGTVNLSTAKADGTFNDVVKVTADNKIHMNGDTWYNGKGIYLTGTNDTNHGMKYDSTVNGPNITGFSGGSLSTTNGGNKSQIMWNVDGSVTMPQNGLKFTRNWSDYSASAIDRAEIANDTTGYKQLMIVGNRSAGAERKVGIWDSLVVNGKLTATGNIEGNSNLCIGGKCVNSAALDKLNQNIMGPVGPVGPAGPTGPKGDQGSPGTAANIGPDPKFNSVGRADALDWFRINEQGKTGPGTAIYGGLAVGGDSNGGLAVGTWDKAPAGNIKLTGSLCTADNTCIDQTKLKTIGNNDPRFNSIGATGIIQGGNIKANELCIGNTCLNENDLRVILNRQGIFGPPLFLWEGFDGYDVPGTGTTIWNFVSGGGIVPQDAANRKTIRFNSTTRTNQRPALFSRIIIPVDTSTHNAIFMRVLTRDRWSGVNMWLIDNNNSLAIKLQSRYNNFNDPPNTPGSSFMGPNNEIATNDYWEWLQFLIPKEYNTNTYLTNSNKITLAVSAAANNQYPEFFCAGIASCPNPYGIATHDGVGFVYAPKRNIIATDPFLATTNGGPALSALAWNNGNWQGEVIVHILEGSIISDIRLNIASTANDLLIGFIEHGNTWYGGAPRIYIQNSPTPNIYYKPSLVTIGNYGMTMKGRINRTPMGIIIPKSILQSPGVALRTSANATGDVNAPGGNALQISITINNALEARYHIRGIWTEIAS